MAPLEETANDRNGETARAAQPVDVQQTVLDQVGGPMGMVYSTIPVVLFAAAVPFASLPVAIGGSIAVALALAVFRMWRGEKFMAAMGGVFGVAAAGGVSAVTGEAADFFLIGIVAAGLAFVGSLISQIARRPVTGMIWNAVHGGKYAWREDRPTLLAHDIATTAVTLMFAARYGVQQWLYLADSTTGLAIADTVTGFPLTAVAALPVIWAFRRSTKRLIKPATA
ncbi:uncharacterized protein DUF3159 [Murinocardiopsis flavida]|uniref:Uncharacterized protein DUF3159 n=1 Tax=Murinocardiopsis flavida TaxID=645275 RepID=A0A2P8DDX5_9ACTN|nr:DUF3159 domain-containing protein [Murinocardiopsis flavida]PSK95433.1 uncharacterized protein DUF3159 [Murinocardiopsis flavida]